MEEGKEISAARHGAGQLCCSALHLVPVNFQMEPQFIWRGPVYNDDQYPTDTSRVQVISNITCFCI
jgi:hypothetical protein